jgi:hypothetical protein
MDAYLGMSESDKYRVTATGAEGLRVKLNTIPIEGDRQVGVDYYQGYSVTLACVGEDKGIRFAGWLFEDGTVVAEREITLYGDASVTALAARFDVSPVFISEVSVARNHGYAVLTNPTDAPVPTQGLYISDDVGDPQKYALPTAMLPGRGELTLVFKDNADARMMMGAALPFNAREGETLVLSDAEGNVLSMIPVPSTKPGEVVVFDEASGLYHVRRNY